LHHVIDCSYSYRCVALARDLYDLWWYGTNVALEEAGVRSMWVREVVVPRRAVWLS